MFIMCQFNCNKRDESSAQGPAVQSKEPKQPRCCFCLCVFRGIQDFSSFLAETLSVSSFQLILISQESPDFC